MEIWRGWCWKRVDGVVEYFRITTDAVVWKSEDMAKTYSPYGRYIAGTIGLDNSEINKEKT